MCVYVCMYVCMWGEIIKCTYTSENPERVKWSIPDWKKKEQVNTEAKDGKKKAKKKKKEEDDEEEDEEEELEDEEDAEEEEDEILGELEGEDSENEEEKALQAEKKAKSTRKRKYEEEEDEEEEEEQEEGVLGGQVFAFAGRVTDKAKITKKIKDNGGKIAEKADSADYIITTKKDAKGMQLSALKKAKKDDIPIHTPDQLDELIKKAGKQKSKTEKKVEKGPPAKKKKVEKIVHVRPTVDNGFEFIEKGEIAGNEHSGFYNAVLSKTDLGDGDFGKNSFYILQLIKNTSILPGRSSKNAYWVYRKWGRVGTDGACTTTPFSNYQKAIKLFEDTCVPPTPSPFPFSLSLYPYPPPFSSFSFSFFFPSPFLLLFS